MRFVRKVGVVSGGLARTLALNAVSLAYYSALVVSFWSRTRSLQKELMVLLLEYLPSILIHITDDLLRRSALSFIDFINDFGSGVVDIRG